MRLQLDTPNLRPAESTPAAPANPGSTPGSRPIDHSTSRDSIGLSGPSAALGRLTEERATRIEQLTAAVRGGTYRVPAATISAAILAQSGA